jgi:predicted  nucleic acid-binding Zn-ribbon protein
MSLIIETDLKDILNKLDQRIDRIDQRLEGIQKDVTDIKINVVKIEGDIKALETKSSIIQPIITGVTVVFVGGILLAVYKSHIPQVNQERR